MIAHRLLIPRTRAMPLMSVADGRGDGGDFSYQRRIGLA